MTDLRDPLAARLQEAAERLSEDESVSGNLTDELAVPLLSWGHAQLLLHALDPQLSDAEFETFVRALQTALRRAAADEELEDAPSILAAVTGRLRALGWPPRQQL